MDIEVDGLVCFGRMSYMELVWKKRRTGVVMCWLVYCPNIDRMAQRGSSRINIWYVVHCMDCTI